MFPACVESSRHTPGTHAGSSVIVVSLILILTLCFWKYWDLRLFPPIFWILLSLVLKVTSIGIISKGNSIIWKYLLTLTVFLMPDWKCFINLKAIWSWFFCAFLIFFLYRNLLNKNWCEEKGEKFEIYLKYLFETDFEN